MLFSSLSYVLVPDNDLMSRIPGAVTYDGPIIRELKYLQPYDWDTLLAFFRAHQLPYLESVDEAGYERVIATSGGWGRFRVAHDSIRHCIDLSVWNCAEEDLNAISSSVRRMFDLDAKPAILYKTMIADSYLASVWNRHPGLRVGRSSSGFETLLRRSWAKLSLSASGVFLRAN